MRRRDWIAVMALTAAVLGGAAVSGCSQNGGQTQTGGENAEDGSQNAAGEAGQDLLAQIQEKGSVTIAMEGTWAPWTYHDEDDQLVGYDVEVGRRIAEGLGVEAEFVEGEWDGLLAGLDAGRYDMMINGVDITEERQNAYDFSEPYAYNRMAVIVRGDNQDIQSMEDLEGKHTANTISSTYAETAEAYGAEVTGVDDLNQTMELLLRARGAALSTEQLMERIWGWDSDAEIHVVWTNIARLRQKLRSLGCPITIRSVRGVGYLLEDRHQAGNSPSHRSATQ